ncbi:MAG TPA: hypothetical protein VEA15_05905 [Caulobacteraceae bacterium]|nr:hypothetical protein [Caulobacteraceae bacterium]
MIAAALVASGLATAAPAADNSGHVRVVVVTLDNSTQGQGRYARGKVASAVALLPGFVLETSPEVEAKFRSCVDDQLVDAAKCARFYVRDIEGGQDAAPLVAVVVANAIGDTGHRRGRAEIACVGSGVAAADATAQSARLWPSAAKLRGVRDLTVDRDSVVACIRAAAREQG